MVIQNMMNAQGSSQDQKTDGKDWKMFRSFFIALHGGLELEFSPSSLFGNEHFMQGNLRNLDLNIKELHVYKGTGNDEHEMRSEETFYNQRIQDLKSMLVGNPLSSMISKIPFLQGIPMSPFPKY